MVVRQDALEPPRLGRAEPCGDARALQSGRIGGLHVTEDLVRDGEAVVPARERAERTRPCSDLDAAGEGVETLPVTRVDLHRAEHAERLAHSFLPAELLRLGKRTCADLPRPGVVARKIGTRCLAREDPRARSTGRRIGQQLRRAGVMLFGRAAHPLHPEAAGEEHLGFRGSRVVAGRQQRVARDFECLDVCRAGDLAHRAGPAKEEIGPFGVVLGPEPERGIVEPHGGVDRAQGGRPIARVAHRPPRGLGQRRGVDTGGSASSSACR